MNYDHLVRLATRRLNENPAASQCLAESSEVVIFGSRALNLARKSSDIDILCVGKNSLKVKSPVLDLAVKRFDQIDHKRWLGSELASHIAKYGVWIKGSPSWVNQVEISSEAIASKKRRIASFLRALPFRWDNLENDFRRKYVKKIRRETQRYLLLERGIAIPPTRILDEGWDAYLIPKQEIESSLINSINDGETRFRSDLLKRIAIELDNQKEPSVHCNIKL